MNVAEIIDWRDVVKDGITYRVILTPDYESNPNDYDCYDKLDIEEFNSEYWRFVNVHVVPFIDGEYIDSSMQVLGSVEYGEIGDRDITLDEIISDVVPDMIEEARDALQVHAVATMRELAAFNRAARHLSIA